MAVKVTSPADFLHKLLKQRSSHPLVQLFRYGLVVAIAFPIDFGLLYIFTSKWHMYYVLSATLSFTISMIANFILSVMWVFTRNTGRTMAMEAMIFGVIGFVGLGITDLIIWIFTSSFGLNYLVSKLIAVMVVFFWSFGARRVMFQKQFKELLRKSAPSEEEA